MKKIISLLIIVFLLAAGFGSVQSKNNDINYIEYTIFFPDISEIDFVDTDNGQRINLEDYDFLRKPGMPMLPEKRLLLALPPDTIIKSFSADTYDTIELLGIYDIVKCPNLQLLDQINDKQIIEIDDDVNVESDNTFPIENIRLICSGSLRKYSYISVGICPFSYNQKSGKLEYYSKITIRLNLDSSLDDNTHLLTDNSVDSYASVLFDNYQDIQPLFESYETNQNMNRQTYDYVIITSSDLVDAIVSSDFISWKNTLGYSIKIVSIEDVEIASQSGFDLSQKIRNFLREYYSIWNIEYVLLVGDIATIPMRYCYPDPTNHLNTAGNPGGSGGDVPTDIYYADLSYDDSVSWDLDGDGYYGEYGQDAPDFLAEVYVGRIPTNVESRISYALNKLVLFEQDTGSWKNNALHAGAFWYFDNEDHTGMGVYDGATCLNEIEQDLMANWTVSHYSEQGGLAPSSFSWPALSHTSFTTDWRTGQYCIVNWGAHGWSDGAARKVWSYDDGDGVPESNEISWPYFIGVSSNIDDDYPSFVFAISCVINYPEPNSWGNIGIDFLTKPGYGASIGVVAATRITYGASNWIENKGGAESLCYEFSHYLINGPSGPEPAGDAMYDSKFFCTTNYGFDHYTEYWNMYNFNLYGDPSLVREGIEPNVLCGDANGDEVVDIDDVVYLISYIFSGGPAPIPEICVGDANGDGYVDIDDVVFLIAYIFSGGSPPVDDCCD